MLLLVLVDAGLLVLFPLFIGYAIDDALAQNYDGSILLILLGISTLIVGAGRRFYDSRFYAKLYVNLGMNIGMTSDTTSSRSAHLGFLEEILEFLESSMPEIVNNTIGLLGTMVIIAMIDMSVLVGCIVVIVVVIVTYGLSEKKITRFNSYSNNEREQQVAVLSSTNPVFLRKHLRTLMKWNVKLSDLEMLNFSLIWLFMMAFLVFSIINSIGEDLVSYGAIFSLILYVFQFIESVIIMPFFYQQWLRLTELTDRIKTAIF